jgi:hypothetical protein
VAYSLVKDIKRVNFQELGVIMHQNYWYFTRIHNFVNGKRNQIRVEKSLSLLGIGFGVLMVKQTDLLRLTKCFIMDKLVLGPPLRFLSNFFG